MKFLPRRESADTRKAKAFKATENSTGKHQSAMEAIARASGSASPVVSSNVSIIPDEMGGKKRVKSLSKPGSHTYSNKEENKTNKGHR